MRYGTYLTGLLLSLASPAFADSLPQAAPTGAPPVISSPSAPRPAPITPVWTALLTADAFARYYPERAARLGISGQAVIKCRVQADGMLGECTVLSEEPADGQFGEAALKLSALFKMQPTTRDGLPTAGGWVVIPIRFAMPAARPPPPVSPPSTPH